MASDRRGRIGWGVVGTGAIVRGRMLDALAADPDSEVVGVVSRNPTRAAALARERAIDCWPDLSAMLADPRIDAVYVASSHDRHAAEACAAVVAGRHVLCEKPLALELDEAEAAVDAARGAGVVLAVNHPLRGLPALRAMREAVADGAIGTPQAARLMYAIHPDLAPGDWHRIGPAAGVLFDISIHTVDCIRFLLGAEVSSVTASGRVGNGWSAAHTVMIGLEMTSGSLVSLHDSLAFEGARNGVELHGTDGAILADGVIGGLDLVAAWELRTPAGRARRVFEAPMPSLFAPTIAAVIAAINGVGEPLASGADHLRTIEVVLRAQRLLDL